MIQLGRKYRDKITGFTGTATGRAAYISGCSQVLLAPPVTSDGAARDANWFDEQRLEVVGEDLVTLENSVTPGCDKAAPVR